MEIPAWTLTAVQFGAMVFDVETFQAGLRSGLKRTGVWLR